MQDHVKYTMGGIGFVSPKFRGMNIFPNLLANGLLWSQGINARWCEHNVLTTNIPVIRSMLKLGFIPSKPISTFHLTKLRPKDD
jgi:hypothetical protein